MTNTETSSSPQGLTEDKILQESTEETTEPVGKDDLPEGAKNVQHAIQLAREREIAAQKKADAVAAELEALKQKEKQKKLSEMSEVERLKALAEDESQKRGKLELKLAVQDAIKGKDLPRGVEEIILRTPWAIPAVAEELGDEFTWDEAIESVKRHLPGYVESLVVEKEQPLEEESSSRSIDSERSVDAAVVSKHHVYTVEEVEALARNPEDWEKHRAKVLKQMADSGGKLPHR